ncbi:UDP-N-acetylmuramoyl-L-alanine--D-glutamate ligase [Candidatus Saccharibacteria bacterium]|nr:UDP-N-acetylmuramoyl-L-alanine--D-glutamate ligase [Candidatus Saccharibacteria bacterium]
MKIVIAGYGVEGKSNLSYFLRKYPQAEFIIAGEQVDSPAIEGVKIESGEGCFERVPVADLAVRTAGLPPRELLRQPNITSASTEFFAKCGVPIIGVTGSKGKGTTVSLISDGLRAAGFRVIVVGNIGVPALDVLEQTHEYDVVVYELSSFQLWDMTASPQIAVVTMMEPDHLDVHASIEEYVAAKSNITRYQSREDTCVYYANNKMSAQVASAGESKIVAVPTPSSVYIKDQNFIYKKQVIGTTEHINLPGEHNLTNVCMALAAAFTYIERYAKESITAELSNDILKAMGQFSGLEHRLKFIANVAGVSYYDDSIATTPGSALAAVKAFSGSLHLIIGGYDKGGDYRELAKTLRESELLKKVYCIGANRRKIIANLQQAGVDSAKIVEVQGNYDELFERLGAYVHRGDTVVLSPAAASFDMFKNYKERGDQFIKRVQALAQTQVL